MTRVVRDKDRACDGEGARPSTIRTHLILPNRLLVLMVLMDDEVVCEDLKGDAGEVDLEEAGSLVATVADEALVAPDGNRSAV